MGRPAGHRSRGPWAQRPFALPTKGIVRAGEAIMTGNGELIGCECDTVRALYSARARTGWLWSPVGAEGPFGVGSAF